MANTPPSGKGSSTKPVTLGPPVLIPDLSEHDRSAAVSAITDILTAYWSRQQALRRPTGHPTQTMIVDQPTHQHSAEMEG